MSLKRHFYDKGYELCYTCKFIDEYALNVNDEGETPHGWDGTAVCCVFNEAEKESVDNRLWVSPCWKACSKYERCTERQADYLDIFDNVSKTVIANPNDISKI